MSSSANSPGTTVIGTGNLPAAFAGGQRRDERAGALGFGRGAQHQDGDILVLVDLLDDLVDLLAFADDFLGRHRLEAGTVELAPEQAE